jgi:RimJ/RimL family protein N-acetyltransferase/catechol 2,3-dioxygenase-like lactoylglutathione lyase family enzyme
MLQTHRLILREFVLPDFDAVHDYASDPLVTRFTSFGPNTAEETRDFLHRCIHAGSVSPRQAHTFAVIEQSSGHLIGSCGLEQCDGTGRHYAFGYCLHRHWWGRGFGQEAARALLQFGFDRLQAHRLWAHVFLGNTASMRILEGLGFRREGLALQSLYVRNAWHDILTFGQLRSEWLAGNPPAIKQSIGLTALVVRDYDEALEFFVGKLGFRLLEDTHIAEQDKRWVVVAPRGSRESALLLARAGNEEQASRIGNQTGGRVSLFLHTDDFWRDYHAYRAKGIVFVREAKEERYGTVAVFQDVYGNQWDLLQPKRDGRTGDWAPPEGSRL